jgi:hypothetical protein
VHTIRKSQSEHWVRFEYGALFGDAFRAKSPLSRQAVNGDCDLYKIVMSERVGQLVDRDLAPQPLGEGKLALQPVQIVDAAVHDRGTAGLEQDKAAQSFDRHTVRRPVIRLVEPEQARQPQPAWGRAGMPCSNKNLPATKTIGFVLQNTKLVTTEGGDVQFQVK